MLYIGELRRGFVVVLVLVGLLGGWGCVGEVGEGEEGEGGGEEGRSMFGLRDCFRREVWREGEDWAGRAIGPRGLEVLDVMTFFCRLD